MIDVIEHLVRLGLSGYEAKAYVAVVTLVEGTVREISEESGVPRSRAYDILNRLAEKGFVEVSSSSPRRYRANEPLVVSNHLMEEMRQASDKIIQELNEIGRKAEERDTPIWTVRGEWAIDHKVGEIMKSADKEVTIFCFSNRTVIRYARLFSSSSEQKRVTIAVSQQVDDFNGILGRSRVLRIRPLEGFPIEIGGKLTREGYMVKDGMYCIEMLMRSDRDISLLLTKERDSHQAIVIIGTILNVISHESMENMIRLAEEIPDAKAPETSKA